MAIAAGCGDLSGEVRHPDRTQLLLVDARVAMHVAVGGERHLADLALERTLACNTPRGKHATYGVYKSSMLLFDTLLRTPSI